MYCWSDKIDVAHQNVLVAVMSLIIVQPLGKTNHRDEPEQQKERWHSQRGFVTKLLKRPSYCILAPYLEARI